PALLVLGSAPRPDAARCPDDRTGVHLRPAGARARGRLLAVCRDHRRRGDRTRADGDPVSGRMRRMGSLPLRGRGTLAACLTKASLVTITSGSTKRRAARWVTTGTRSEERRGGKGWRVG